MQDLSLHILDIAENSVRAGANLIEITMKQEIISNCLILEIKDNGVGMSEQMLKYVENPFFTTRSTRRIGLGIPLLKQNCEMTEGSLEIKSVEGIGTCLKATMRYDHIDRLPVGDLTSTLVTLIRMHPKVDWVYVQSKEKQEFKLDTRVLKEILGEVSIQKIEIINWIREYINQHLGQFS